MAIEIAESILFRALSRHDLTSTVIVDIASGNEFSYDTLLRDALHVKFLILTDVYRTTEVEEDP